MSKCPRPTPSAASSAASRIPSTYGRQTTPRKSPSLATSPQSLTATASPATAPAPSGPSRCSLITTQSPGLPPSKRSSLKTACLPGSPAPTTASSQTKLASPPPKGSSSPTGSHKECPKAKLPTCLRRPSSTTPGASRSPISSSPCPHSSKSPPTASLITNTLKSIPASERTNGFKPPKCGPATAQSCITPSSFSAHQEATTSSRKAI